MTLIGVAVAGGLIWLASWIGPRDSMRDYWIAMGLVAGAGLVMALSQLAGGWTKWGVPSVSPNVLLLGFLPALVAGGWILVAAQPGGGEAREYIANWSSDVGISGVVADMTPIVGAIAFAIGLVFGLVFDTTGPRRRGVVEGDRAAGDGYARDDRYARDPSAQRGRATAAAQSRGRAGYAEDEPVTAERGGTYDDGRTDDGRAYDDDTVERRSGEPVGVSSRDEQATPSAPQPEPDAQPRRRSLFRR
jgi:hypothetical protein